MASIVLSQVPVQEVVHPVDILKVDGKVKPEIAVNDSYALWGGPQAENDPGRVARHEAQQQKDNDRHPEQYGNSKEQPPQDMLYDTHRTILVGRPASSLLFVSGRPAHRKLLVPGVFHNQLQSRDGGDVHNVGLCPVGAQEVDLEGHR